MKPRGDRGEMSLTGLVVAMALSLAITGGTLTVYESFSAAASEGLRRNDVQDTARRGADELARDLRNLAGPTSDQPQAVDQAGPYELVFKAVDSVGPNAGQNAANVLRRRYCLGGSPGDGRLYVQTQRWTSSATPAMPSTAACPAPVSVGGWGAAGIVAEGVTNRRDGLERPVFFFDGAAPTVSGIHVDLLVDDDPTRDPPEARLGTGVFLRNQNRPPVPSFTATRTAQGIVLNGSASVDPEGEPLTWTWLDGGTPVAGCSTITCTYRPPAGVRQLSLRVQDPSGLAATSAAQEVSG